jgi:hypothetical protein
MAKGINVNYGSLHLSTPAIVMPVSQQIGSMSQAVIQKMNNSEGSPFAPSSTQNAYDTINTLMANNQSYQAQQAASNSAFNNQAVQAAEYQANAISNQGKK